ncbi:MAG: GNAT family N-acetyltransferase [Dehalococcoidales bacterium]|nr:GNAT family N-acetyltransferase [Dehalococcoidales bacterium]
MINGEKIIIREKRPTDVRDDYQWGRDPELSRLDAAQPLNMSFTQFATEFTAEIRFPLMTRRRYGVDTLAGEHIANCSYYNIDVRRGETEVGIMIGNRDYWNKGYGTDIIKTLVKYIFERTNIKRLYLKTLDWNVRAQKCFNKCGFVPYNHLPRDSHNFIMMELTRSQWKKLQEEKPENEKETQRAQ